MEMIYAERGRHFDPQVVDALLEITPEFADIAQRFRDDEVAIG